MILPAGKTETVAIMSVRNISFRPACGIRRLAKRELRRNTAIYQKMPMAFNGIVEETIPSVSHQAG